MRVAGLKRLTRGGKRAVAIVGEDPRALLERIQKLVIASSRRFDSIYRKIIRELAEEKIFIVNERQISAAQGEFVREYFQETVLPTLSPIILDQAPSFPSLRDRSIYFALKLELRHNDKHPRYALIELSSDIPRFLVLPARGERQYVMLVDDVIRYCLREIFPTREYSSVTAHTLKVTLDAELDIDNDISRSLIDKISRSVKKRKSGAPVRFGYDESMPPDMLRYVLKQLGVKSENIIPGSRYHNFRDFINFPRLGRDELRYEVPQPLLPPLVVKARSLFDVIVSRRGPALSVSVVPPHHRSAARGVDRPTGRVDQHDAVPRRHDLERGQHADHACRNGQKSRGGRAAGALRRGNTFSGPTAPEGRDIVFGVPHLKVHTSVLITRKETARSSTRAHRTGNSTRPRPGSTPTRRCSPLTGGSRMRSSNLWFLSHNLQHVTTSALVSPFNLRKRFVQISS